MLPIWILDTIYFYFFKGPKMLGFEWIVAFLVLGCVVGFVAGLLGVGGGGILVPLLTSLFLLQGISADNVVHLALGTSMACIIVTSISSMRAHNKTGAIRWDLVKSMSVGIIAGTFCATFIAAYLNSFYLAIIFATFMAITALKLLKKTTPQAVQKPEVTKGVLLPAFGIGAVSALVSIGGGSLTVPYLTSRNLTINRAIATSAAIGLPISLTGTIGYLVNGWGFDFGSKYTIGFIYLPAFLLISVSSFYTAPFGVRASHYLPVHTLKKIFACLLITLSIKMLWSVI